MQHPGAAHREHDPAGGGQRQDAPARVRARGRRQHGHESDAGVLHRHTEVLRHEDHEEELCQVLVLQERQQRAASLHPEELGQ